jgi:hypothetical protein
MESTYFKLNNDMWNLFHVEQPNIYQFYELDIKDLLSYKSR